MIGVIVIAYFRFVREPLASRSPISFGSSWDHESPFLTTDDFSILLYTTYGVFDSAGEELKRSGG